MSDEKTAPLITEPNGKGAIYLVRRGDNLTKLVNRNAQMCLRNPAEAIGILMEDNPHIKNANLIYPGQPVFLRSTHAFGSPLPATTAADIRLAIQTLASHNSPELSALAENSTAVGMALGGLDKMNEHLGAVVKQNSVAVKNLMAHHVEYRNAGASRSGYKAFNAQRAVVLETMQRDFGQSTKYLLGKSAKEAMSLVPGQSAKPRIRMSEAAESLSKFSGGLKTAGRVMTVVDIAVNVEITRQNVCAADSRLAKNQELTKGGGSFVGSAAGSTAGAVLGTAFVAVALGSNPAGWAVLLVVGAGGALGAYLGGKGGGALAEKAYTKYGSGYDLVEMSGVETLCR